MSRVAILVPNYNGLQLLDKVFLQSLESALKIKAFSQHTVDVYLIDNGSSDNSVDAVRDKFAEVKVIKLGKNYGFAGAIFKAIKDIGISKYDYIAVMNNDYVIANEEALDQLIKPIENRNDICVNQGINIYPNGVIEDCGFFYDSFLNPIPRWRGVKYSEYPEKYSYITYASFAFSLIKLRRCPPLLRRKWILDPRFFGYYDDADAQLYLWTHGFKSIASPVLVGVHYESRTFGRMNKLQGYLSARNKMLVLNSYWRYHLSSYKATLLFKYYILNLYKVALNRVEYFRGLYDALSRRRNLNLGPYHPLVLVMKTIKIHLKELMPDALLWNLLNDGIREMHGKLSQRFVRDKDLKTSVYPYILTV